MIVVSLLMAWLLRNAPDYCNITSSGESCTSYNTAPYLFTIFGILILLISILGYHYLRPPLLNTEKWGPPLDKDKEYPRTLTYVSQGPSLDTEKNPSEGPVS